MKPHEHAELIKAWADGAEIEYFDGTRSEWRDCTDNSPIWHKGTSYRIKPASITLKIPRPVLVNLERDLYISFRFESVEDAEKARDAIKELMK
jgi:hypothetical protein